MTNINVSSAARKNKDLIDNVFTRYKFKKNHITLINIDKHSTCCSSRETSYNHAEKYNSRHEVLQMTRNHESINNEIIN
jgi:hypothetical protein